MREDTTANTTAIGSNISGSASEGSTKSCENAVTTREWGTAAGDECALKVMEKRHILRERKGAYVKMERVLLDRLRGSPGVVQLLFTFQDEHSLCEW